MEFYDPESSRRVCLEIPLSGVYDALRFVGLLDRIVTRIWRIYGDGMNQIIAEGKPGTHFYLRDEIYGRYLPLELQQQDEWDDALASSEELPF